MKTNKIIILVLIMVGIYLIFFRTVKTPDSNMVTNGEVKEYEFKTTYVTPVDWPAIINTVDEPFSCVNAGLETDRAGITQSTNIGGTEYCITKVSEGAAGSTYTQYAIARAVGSVTEIATFILRFPQCMNYDDPKQSDCLKEQREFDLAPVVQSIFR